MNRAILKKIKMAAAFLLAFFMLAGCGETEMTGETVSEPAEEGVTIGMSFDSFLIERWQRDRDIFVQTAKDLGAEVNVQNANGDIEEQKKQIRYLIDKGVDVIVVVCIDSDSLTDVVKEAKDAGIKVIAYDRLINNADVDLYVSFDNEKVGTLMGKCLISKGVGGGKVIVIGGSMQDNNVHLVEDGFEKVMSDNRVEIIGTTHCDGWRSELASEYLYDNPDLLSECDAIMCGNDNIASQVVNVLSVQRLAGDILVTGQDADLEACQRIVEGTQVMTVYKPVEKLARCAAECAVMLAEGEEITGYDVIVTDNGFREVPYVNLEPVMVTKDNMDETIISSGFHTHDEVYLNVK